MHASAAVQPGTSNGLQMPSPSLSAMHVLAVVCVFRELTFGWVNGRRVIVAGTFIQTTSTRCELARAIICVGRLVVVARRGVDAAFGQNEARAIVVRGIAVEVDGVWVGAAQNLKRITNAVSIGVFQAVAVAVVSVVSKFTRPGQNGFWVVVARNRVQTTGAALVLTASVVGVGVCIVVASHGHGAAQEQAVAAVLGCSRVVVVGFWVCAAEA